MHCMKKRDTFASWAADAVLITSGRCSEMLSLTTAVTSARRRKRQYQDTVRSSPKRYDGPAAAPSCRTAQSTTASCVAVQHCETGLVPPRDPTFNFTQFKYPPVARSFHFKQSRSRTCGNSPSKALETNQKLDLIVTPGERFQRQTVHTSDISNSSDFHGLPSSWCYRARTVWVHFLHSFSIP